MDPSAFTQWNFETETIFTENTNNPAFQTFRSTGTHSDIREVCFFCSLECALILFTHPQLTWNIVMMQWWMTPARCSHEIVGGDDRGLDGCGDMVHCGWGDIPSPWCLHCKSGPRPPGMLTHDGSTPALSCGGHFITDPLLHRWAIKCLETQHKYIQVFDSSLFDT